MGNGDALEILAAVAGIGAVENDDRLLLARRAGEDVAPGGIIDVRERDERAEYGEQDRGAHHDVF